MRVIAGVARGRRLKAPTGLATRPTLARVKESIFSRLAARMDLTGLRVLDLFAGTGSLGIEALSRGASHVTFVESARAAVAALEHNLATLGFASCSKVIKADVLRALEQLAAQAEVFDLVLSDPPYRKNWGAPVFDRLVALNLLVPEGWAVTEVSRLEDVPASQGGLIRVNLGVVGDAQIALYKRANEEAAT